MDQKKRTRRSDAQWSGEWKHVQGGAANPSERCPVDQNRGVLLALVCSLPSLQGGFAFFGFALVAPRGLLFVIPERTFRIAVFWCFSKMLFLARERQNAGLEM